MKGGVGVAPIPHRFTTAFDADCFHYSSLPPSPPVWQHRSPITPIHPFHSSSYYCIECYFNIIYHIIILILFILLTCHPPVTFLQLWYHHHCIYVRTSLSPLFSFVTDEDIHGWNVLRIELRLCEWSLMSIEISCRSNGPESRGIIPIYEGPACIGVCWKILLLT